MTIALGISEGGSVLNPHGRTMPAAAATVDDRDSDGQNHQNKEDIGQIELHLRRFQYVRIKESQQDPAAPVPIFFCGN